MQRGLAGYRSLRRLSTGGQGEAYLAVDERLQRRVVIKLYRLERDLAGRRRAVAEARRLALIESSRVVRIHDVVASGARLALVTQYVPGCDLAQLLARGAPLPPALAVSIAVDIAAGLAAAHRHRLVHGDLQAANVLIDRRGRATLIDFGIAATVGQPAAAGSRAALSPEHLRREPLSRQSDLFALGLLLYRMLYGRHPFAVDGRVEPAQLAAGVRALPPLPELDAAIAAPLRALLGSLLAARPQERPVDARSLRRGLGELRRALAVAPAPPPLLAELAREAQEPPQEAPPPLPRRLVRLPRRQRWRAALAALWGSATTAARLSMCLAVLALAAVPVLLLLAPGPCIEVRPVRLELGPGDAAFLPAPAALERRLVARLREHYRRPRVLGAVPGSDSRRVLQARGMRDICVPQRVLQLDLRCAAGECRLALNASDPPRYHRSQLRLPLGAGLAAVQQALDQLVRQHLDSAGF